MEWFRQRFRAEVVSHVPEEEWRKKGGTRTMLRMMVLYAGKKARTAPNLGDFTRRSASVRLGRHLDNQWFLWGDWLIIA